MYIKWHGHACFEIGNARKVVIDPHDGKSIGLPPPKVSADYVLVTHEHFDHNATGIVLGQFTVLNSIGDYTYPGLVGKAYRAYHDEHQGKQRGEIRVFSFNFENVHFIHVGDLGHIIEDPLAKELHNPDILFLPVGGIFTIDAKQAYKVIEKLKPRVAVPMHYLVNGLTLGLKPVETFLKLYPKEIIKTVGNSITFKKEDLPANLNIWVFSL